MKKMLPPFYLKSPDSLCLLAMTTVARIRRFLVAIGIAHAAITKDARRVYVAARGQDGALNTNSMSRVIVDWVTNQTRSGVITQSSLQCLISFISAEDIDATSDEIVVTDRVVNELNLLLHSYDRAHYTKDVKAKAVRTYWHLEPSTTRNRIRLSGYELAMIDGRIVAVDTAGFTLNKESMFQVMGAIHCMHIGGTAPRLVLQVRFLFVCA